METNGIAVDYDSFGDSHDEAILLVSGLGAQRIRWTDAFCTALATHGFRVIRFDNRDTGLSTHLSDHPVPDFAALAAAAAAGKRLEVPYTLHDMAADAIGLLDALSIDKVHVVGRSMGGMIAQLMASTYPERVLSLTSIMSSTGNPALPQAAPDVMALLMKPAPRPADDEAGFLAHSVAFAKRIAGSAHPFDEDAHRGIVREEVRRAHDPAGFARQIAAIAATGDLRVRNATIRAPTLVIHGEDDALIPPACGEDTAASIEGAHLKRVAGMGHDLPASLHADVIDAIVRLARRGRVDDKAEDFA
ncbi:alpha/beta hydrolase [Luteibacter sp.]|uniref:alpha/beta fold hydrolase n=1 Tax=Luteibacter sp. TaxID=1886636 RepID=UPI0025BED2D7|nr:alpha/beta hydrolase [Luteibacter sp.]